jgi:hypothetical protein
MVETMGFRSGAHLHAFILIVVIRQVCPIIQHVEEVDGSSDREDGTRRAEKPN